MDPVVVNESFSNRRYGPLHTSANWPLTWIDGVWGDQEGEYDAEGYFRDILFEMQVPGKTPSVMPAESNGLDESDASAVTLHDQHFFAGPTTSGTGVALSTATATQVHYLDHGGHR